MKINIPLKRSGFEVKIGDVELWVDTSAENLKKITRANAFVDERLKKLDIKDINLPDEITVESVEGMDPDVLDNAFEIYKEYIAAQYDVIFGDGTFKKIYKKHPDVSALEEALEAAMPAIAERLIKCQQH